MYYGLYLAIAFVCVGGWGTGLGRERMPIYLMVCWERSLRPTAESAAEQLASGDGGTQQKCQLILQQKALSTVHRITVKQDKQRPQNKKKWASWFRLCCPRQLQLLRFCCVLSRSVCHSLYRVLMTAQAPRGARESPCLFPLASQNLKVTALIRDTTWAELQDSTSC